MKVKYLLIGYDLDGQIEVDSYPQEKLMIIRNVIRAAGNGHQGDPVRFFEVHTVNYKGSLYPVAMARQASQEEVWRMIDKSGIEPLPEE